MPYRSIKGLPNNVSSNMGKRAQEIYRKAFNNAYKQYNGNEKSAVRVAWSALKKSGYRKSLKTNHWIKKRK